MLGTLLLAGSLAAPVTPQDVASSVTIPDIFVAGQPFMVELVYEAGEGGSALEAWRLGPGAFEANGEPIASRDATGKIELPKGSSMSLRLDLSSYLEGDADFQLALAGAGADAAKSVSVFGAASEELNFMEMPVEELGNYVVLLQTNQGPMMVEFWPDVAPNHVRNFLDLSATGFYEGIQFHRVSPNFMIQGGCPHTKSDRKSQWGTGRGPRMLDAEFSDKKHQRGVLSMARGGDPNSASSQFFVMTADSFFLDGQYSAFGKLVSGFDAVDKIARAEGRRAQDGTVRPNDPQRIERAVVLKNPGK